MLNKEKTEGDKRQKYDQKEEQKLELVPNNDQKEEQKLELVPNTKVVSKEKDVKLVNQKGLGNIPPPPPPPYGIKPSTKRLKKKQFKLPSRRKWTVF